MNKLIAVLVLSLLVAGCVTGPEMRLVGNHYYMTGDASCRWWQPDAVGDLMCYDKDKNFTGYRTAMSSQDAQIYQLQQLQSEQRAAVAAARLKESNRQTFNQLSQSMPAMATPTVQGIPSTSTTTYNQVGDTLIGTDGSSCQTAGESTVCRD